MDSGYWTDKETRIGVWGSCRLNRVEPVKTVTRLDRARWNQETGRFKRPHPLACREKVQGCLTGPQPDGPLSAIEHSKGASRDPVLAFEPDYKGV